MFPIILDPKHVRFMLVGRGPLSDKRFAQLTEAGADVRRFEGNFPTEDQIKTAHIVYIADVPHMKAEGLAQTCRRLGVLVNVEDVLPLCDFHTPAMVRRGDLLLSISTNGKSPALARRLKNYLAARLDGSWAEKLDKIGQMRQEWRSQGLSMAEVGEKTDALITAEGWLPVLEIEKK